MFLPLLCTLCLWFSRSRWYGSSLSIMVIDKKEIWLELMFVEWLEIMVQDRERKRERQRLHTQRHANQREMMMEIEARLAFARAEQIVRSWCCEMVMPAAFNPFLVRGLVVKVERRRHGERELALEPPTLLIIRRGSTRADMMAVPMGLILLEI